MLTYIEDYAFSRNSISSFHTPDNLKGLGTNVFFENQCEMISFTGKYASDDGGKCLIIDGTLYTAVDICDKYLIPSGVSVIADLAFFGKRKLSGVVLPEGLNAIGYGAFSQCELFGGDIHIPESVEFIGERCFAYNDRITGFYGNKKYTDESGLFLIDGQSIVQFATGSKASNVVIPEGIVRIAYGCFYGCDYLETVTFPSSLQIIGVDAFDNCTNLTQLMGANVSADNKCLILDGALSLFAGKGVTKYETPKETRYIEDIVFRNKPQLEEIILNDEITYIGMYAFNDNPNLKKIVLPAHLKEMSYDPFKGSDALEEVYCRSIIPPVMSDVVYQTDFQHLKIYVPEQSLEAYMNNSSWAPYRAYLKGYNYTDLPENDTYVSSDYSKDGVVTTLQTATKGEGIDIVLMGDAYSDRQIADGTYKTDMEYIYNNLFTEEPYKSFKDYFNVHYVNVVSATEGYEYGNTALDTFFGDGTFVGGSDNACFEYALKAVSGDRMDEALIIVAMNSDNYAGTCYMYYPESATGPYGSGPSVAYFPKGGDQTTFAQLLHHEANGHGFAKLADEYAYEAYGEVPSDNVTQTRDQQNDWGWWKNVDFTNDPKQVRWSYFLEDARYANEGLGVFEGGLTYWTGVWRPTEDSIMRNNTGGFNAPSREAIYYRIHKLAYGDSWEYDYEDFVEYDAINRASSASAPQKSRGDYVERTFEPTAPPVIVNKSWREVK